MTLEDIRRVLELCGCDDESCVAILDGARRDVTTEITNVPGMPGIVALRDGRMLQVTIARHGELFDLELAVFAPAHTCSAHAGCAMA